MTEFDRRIIALSPGLYGKINAAANITTLNHVVEELLKNSLDANAKSIEIWVDYTKGYCSVKDDGHGIPAIEFQEGNLARPHFTSKHDSSPSVHGGRGLSLFHISKVSLLSIESRHHQESMASSVIIKNQGPNSDGLHSISVEPTYASCGTQITVYNLFAQLPVRAKVQATRFSDKFEAEKEFNALRMVLAAYQLACKRVIMLKIQDRQQHKHKQICRPEILDDSATSTSFSLSKIQSILSQYGLLFSKDLWEQASVRVGKVSLKAAILLTPMPSKQWQFISFGDFPLLAGSKWSHLHEMVNQIFDQSLFGADEVSCFTIKCKDGLKVDSQKSRPVKSVDKYPVYHLRVDHADATMLKSLSRFTEHEYTTNALVRSVSQAVSALFKEFLSRHNLQHRAQRRQAKNTVKSDTNLQDSSLSSNREDQSQLLRWQNKEAHTNNELLDGLPFSELIGGCINPFQPEIDSLLADLANQDDSSLSNDGLILEEDAFVPELDSSEPKKQEQESPITWHNPKSGLNLNINSRNGFVIPSGHGRTESLPFRVAKVGNEAQAAKGRLSLISELSQSIAKYSSNLTFEVKEMPLSKLPTTSDTNLAGVSAALVKVDGIPNAHRLDSACVISQVDRKFILALVPAVSTAMQRQQPKALVLIDQHAADERVKVEQLYVELCKTPATSLAQPITFEVDEEEAKLLEQYREFFGSWSIIYDLDRRSNESNKPKITQFYDVKHNFHLVRINGLPGLVVERCRREPKIIINIIRKHIWSDDLKMGKIPETRHNWLLRLSNCPQGLLDLINSRACRSAIMFNDKLNHTQCQILVQQLSKCQFPLQCAHGRPTMIVLTGIKQEQFALHNELKMEHLRSFEQAFNDWL